MDDDVFVLNPFIVESTDDEGYLATETLAGTRLKTDLSDVASAITIVTGQFLEDTGATDSESLLIYTANTEVGGLSGNFAGLGNSQGVNESSRLLAPSNNTRVRGLDEADNTRNFFLTDIPWDGFNVDRVEMQRGPNSILFGVGSPAGIINVNTATAGYVDEGKIEFRVDNEASTRAVFDVNHVVIEDELAVRVIALVEDEQFQQEPAFEDDRRIFGAVRYEPRLFGAQHGPLSIRANFEHGDITANRPRILPPYDHITTFYTELDQQVYEPAYAWEYGQQLDRGTSLDPVYDQDYQPGLKNDIPGIINQSPVVIWDEEGGSFSSAQQLHVRGDGIQGLSLSRPVIPAGVNELSKNINALDPTQFPGATSDFYKDQTLSDPSIFNFYDQLIDGDNKREWNDWQAYNIALSQTFFGTRLGVEFVYDYQDVTRGQEGIMTGLSPYIAVDINSHYQAGPEFPVAYDLTDLPADTAPDPATVSNTNENPNAGRPFVVADGQAGNVEEEIERENFRLTGFGELHGSDFFDDDSFLARFLGRHVLTGLVSQDTRESSNKAWQLYAVEESYAESTGLSASLSSSDRSVQSIIYLGDDLRGTSSPSGLNLPSVEANVNPGTSLSIGYFDPTPSPQPGVNLSDPWVRPIDGDVLTEEANPANYVGWTTETFDVLNAQEGDRDDLVYQFSRRHEEVESVGFVWQGFLWDGAIVPTVGWRRDEITSYGGEAPALDELTGLRDTSFALQRTAENSAESAGETLSWGVVVHAPEFIRRHLPWESRLSFFYNQAENFEAVNRVGYDANDLPNPTGESDDFGFVLSTFNDRLTVRATWYDTKVNAATLPGDSPLGANIWYLYLQEAWGTAAALTHELWRAGEAPGMGWYSNWANPDEGFSLGDENLPAEGFDHPSFVSQTAAIQDWYATMPAQEWFDAWGLPIDVAAAQSSDFERRRQLVTDPNWNVYSGIGSIQAAGGGRVNGADPSVAVDQESTGFELEVTARPTPNWNLTFNLTKVDSERGALGANTVNWIESRRARYAGPAGDMRQWWAGDRTVREFFDDFVYAPYLFQLDAAGQQAPEVRPWRFNLVTTYRFDDGFLDGLSVGGGYRWQDDIILGYELRDDLTNLDPNRPIYGASEDAIDLWCGYERMLSDSLEWKIQLNVRNAFEDDHLVPISVNPDGTVAAQRIADGQSWFITNTISF